MNTVTARLILAGVLSSLYSSSSLPAFSFPVASAVAAFLAEQGSYLGIAECVEAVMDAHEREGVQKVESLEQLQALDAWARETARKSVR